MRAKAELGGRSHCVTLPGRQRERLLFIYFIYCILKHFMCTRQGKEGKVKLGAEGSRKMDRLWGLPGKGKREEGQRGE